MLPRFSPLPCPCTHGAPADGEIVAAVIEALAEAAVAGVKPLAETKAAAVAPLGEARAAAVEPLAKTGRRQQLRLRARRGRQRSSRWPWDGGGGRAADQDGGAHIPRSCSMMTTSLESTGVTWLRPTATVFSCLLSPLARRAGGWS